MSQVKYHKAMGIILYTFNADTAPSSATGHIGMIHTDIYLAIVRIDEAAALGLSLIDIVDVTARWIVFLTISLASQPCQCILGSANSFKVEHGEEILSAIVILEGIASYTKMDQTSASKERGEMHDQRSVTCKEVQKKNEGAEL
jgi:hypothetical protein